MLREWVDVRVDPTTDTSLPAFDNTRLVAINTCPTYGIVSYTLNKRIRAGGRSMALEAGKAAHEVFAAHRLHHIREHGSRVYGLNEADTGRLFRSTGIRLFGEARFTEMVDAIDPHEDVRTQQIAFCLAALHNGEFYDNPADRKRTVTNIEEMCIAYMDKYDWQDQMPVIYGGTVGIEIPMDVTVSYTMTDGSIEEYRLIGRVDGIHWKDEKKEELRLHENKTASRLDEAWRESHTMSHQHTGYMIGMSALTGQQIRNTLVLGSALPMPIAYNINGLARVPVIRHDYEVISWFDWFLETIRMHDRYADDPANAPHYTHSCNRYFRPCPLIPLCASPPEDRVEMIAEMHDEHWSPLDNTAEPSDE